MNALFVDTSAWVAAADAADPAHEAVRRARDQWLASGGLLISTDYIADETLTVLRSRLGIDAARTWWALVTSSRRVVWEDIDGPRRERARDWFFRQGDKGYSFTDCTSFVVMKELRLSACLATDHHFRQAGFSVRPKSTA